MTAAGLPHSVAPPRGFQFRLGTLLVTMAWAGLVSLGLRTPTPLWSGAVAVITLFAVLMAVLLVIYRIGRIRAMSVGFLVFCLGYLTYLAVLTGTLSSGLSSSSTPVGAAFEWLFESIHPPQQISGGFGSMSGMGAIPGEFSGGMGVGIAIKPYNESNFIAIANNALACILGIIGAFVAQTLYASRSAASD